MKEISRRPDTRDSLSRWNGSQVEALPELSWPGPVAFHFTRGSCTLLSPAIERDFFCSKWRLLQRSTLVKMWRLSICGVLLEFRRGWTFGELWDYFLKKTTGTSEVKMTVFLHYESYWGARSGMLGFEFEMSIIGSRFYNLISSLYSHLESSESFRRWDMPGKSKSPRVGFGGSQLPSVPVCFLCFLPTTT